MRHKARDRRKEQRKERQERTVRDKFQDVRREQVTAQAITPLNDRQAEYMDAIRSKDLVIATGYAGTSKTFVATCMAADAFRLNECKRIVLARPAVSGSQSLGFFSGDANEKMLNWAAPMVQVLNKRLGKAIVDIAIAEGNIILQPLETIKGMSFGKDTWVIVDETQDCSIEEVKSIVTRAGGCKLVLCGDVRQSALADTSGLAIFVDVLENNRRLQESVAHIDFDDYSHIVRSKLCRELIIAFDREGL